MKKRIVALIALVSAFAHLPVQAGVSVFACEPEWAALAQAVGGDLVTSYSATSGRQDPHFLQARPSLIAKVRKADLVLCTGAGLEQGWLPVLLQKARNPRVLPGQPGYLAAADQVTLLEKPDRLDRAEGDIHAEGNPHIQTDPRRLLKVALAIGQRLAELDPDNAETYAAATASFDSDWQEHIKDWEGQAQALRGVTVVQQHRQWVYLLDWLGLESVATLEPKPGVSPSAGYLGELKGKLLDHPPGMIIRAPIDDERPAQWLSEQIAVPVVTLPQTIGATDDATDLKPLFDIIVARLLGALK